MILKTNLFKLMFLLVLSAPLKSVAMTANVQNYIVKVEIYMKVSENSLFRQTYLKRGLSLNIKAVILNYFMLESSIIPKKTPGEKETIMYRLYKEYSA